MSLTVCKAEDANVALTLGFVGGREQELVLTGPHGELWRFSSSVNYVQGAHSRTLQTGTCLTWHLTWSGLDAAGNEVGPGHYRLTQRVEPSSINGRQSDLLGAPMGWDFSVTG